MVKKSFCDCKCEAKKGIKFNPANVWPKHPCLILSAKNVIWQRNGF